MRNKLINWIVKFFFEGIDFRLKNPNQEFDIARLELLDKARYISSSKHVDAAWDALDKFGFRFRYHPKCKTTVAAISDIIERKDFIVANSKLGKVQ